MKPRVEEQAWQGGGETPLSVSTGGALLLGKKTVRKAGGTRRSKEDGAG